MEEHQDSSPPLPNPANTPTMANAPGWPKEEDEDALFVALSQRVVARVGCIKPLEDALASPHAKP